MHRGLFRSQIEPVMNHLYTYYIKRKINSKLGDLSGKGSCGQNDDTSDDNTK